MRPMNEARCSRVSKTTRHAGFIAKLRRGRRGTVAIEFAMVMPILVTAILGVVDTCRAIIAWQLLTSSAEAVAEIATAESAIPDSSGNYELSDAQVQDATTAIYAFMPALNTGDGGNDYSAFSVTLSAIQFTTATTATASCPSGSACVMWSVVGSYSTNEGTFAVASLQERVCGTALTQNLPGSSPSLTTLPTSGLTGVNSLIVADVQYQFTPLFVKFITGPISMFRTAYLPARVGSATPYVQYVAPTGAPTDFFCPGYPTAS